MLNDTAQKMKFSITDFYSKYDQIMNKIIKLWLASLKSSHRRCSVRKGVLRNFAIFTGKHLYQSLFFNKVAGLRSATLLKTRLWRRCFSVTFAKFLSLQSTSGWLLLNSGNHLSSYLCNSAIATTPKLHNTK